jgi:hypothetical protein
VFVSQLVLMVNLRCVVLTCRFNFSNNTLLNTVLRFNVNYVSDTTERIVIEQNKLLFTRPLSTGSALGSAIATGGANVQVEGNTVDSVLPDGVIQPANAVGIAVSQTGYETTQWPRTNGPNGQCVQSTITANFVSGFHGRTAIRFLGNATNATMVYPVRIEINTVDGEIYDCSPAGRDQLEAHGNHDYTGRPVSVSHSPRI